MVQALQVFRTTDGEVFEDELLAQQHQAGIDNKEAIDAFVDKHFPHKVDEEGKKKQNNARGYARKAVELWLAEQAA